MVGPDELWVEYPAQIAAIKANIGQFTICQGIQLVDDSLAMEGRKQSAEHRTHALHQRQTLGLHHRYTEAHCLCNNQLELAIVNRGGHGNRSFLVLPKYVAHSCCNAARRLATPAMRAARSSPHGYVKLVTVA